MAELESGRRVCDVCRNERRREEFDDEFRLYPVGGVKDICCDCVRRFVVDCFEGWQRKQAWDNQVIGGYRQAELAYCDEYEYEGPPDCDRCRDNRGYTGGQQFYIVLPQPNYDRITLCYDCHDDWEAAADVYEDGRGWLMSPAAAAAFQWSGVESQDARRWRAMKAQREVRKRQGDRCADCGIPDGPGIYFKPWPPEQPDGFVMVCRSCEDIKGAAQAGVEA